MFELLWEASLTLVQAKYLVPLVLGTLVGVVGGALPGVTITMTVIVVLPFTFGLDPLQGLAAMTGVYVGGSAGGLVTATLLGIPGTPSSIATTFDGHPMARQGEAGRALWTGVWASFFGGILGGAFLIAATGPLAAFALQFGPWEFFSLFVLALSMVAGLVGASLLKGLLAGESDLAHGCFKVTLDAGENISEMEPLSCAEPHQAEFVGVWTASGTTLANLQDNSDRKHTECRKVVADYVKVPKDGDLQYRTGTIALPPEQEAWEAGDRGVRCFLWFGDRKLTRSLKGAGTKGLPINYA